MVLVFSGLSSQPHCGLCGKGLCLCVRHSSGYCLFSVSNPLLLGFGEQAEEQRTAKLARVRRKDANKVSFNE